MELDDLLSAVPWSELEGAGGPASDVPGAVRTLTSPDAEERTGALGFLSEFLWDQGTIFPPSVEVIGPLALLLSRPGFPEPEAALEFLDRLAIGNGLFTAHRALSIFRDMHGPETIAAKVAAEAVMLARRDAEMRRCAPVFRTYLTHADPAVRAAATRLLGRRPFAG